MPLAPGHRRSDEWMPPTKRRRSAHTTPIRQREDCAITQRDARHAAALRRQGSVLVVLAILLLMGGQLVDFGLDLDMGLAEEVFAMTEALSATMLAVAAKRYKEWHTITWLDPDLWLFFKRDPAYACDFDHFLSGRGRGSAWGLLRVRAVDLPRLFAAWAIPDTFKASNGSYWDGEEALVAFLCRCATNVVWTQMESLLNRRFQDLSKMFYLVLHHISALADSRKDMIDWMARGYRAYDGSYVNFDTMKAAINRLRENTCPHPEAGVKQFCDHVVALYDCTCYRIGNCGSVLVNGHLFDLQNWLYSQYYRDQGFKGGVLTFPNGIGGHYGFQSLRHNDNHVVHALGLGASWAAAVQRWCPGARYIIYGDSIFAQTAWMSRPYLHAASRSIQAARNANMSVVRIPNEWHFGNQANKIKFVGRLGRNKIMEQPVELFLSVANFLHNCLVCLHGSQTESYFDVPAPSLEQYCGTADHNERPGIPDPRAGRADSDDGSDSD